MNWYDPSTPENIQPIPWLHEAAIEYLHGIIKPGARVLEFGSGGSTLWLSKLAERVTTIEANEVWYKALKAIKPDNVNLIFHNHDSLPPDINPQYDIVFIDGDPVTYRSNYINTADTLVGRGGWFVLDNCNRPEYAREREELQKKAKLTVTFMTHPGQYLNTEFYNL